MRNVLNMNKIKEIKKKHYTEKLEDYSSKMLESPCQRRQCKFANLIAPYNYFLVVYNEKENGNIETNYQAKIFIRRSIRLLAKVSLELKFSSKEVDSNIIKRVYLETDRRIIFDTKTSDIDFKNIFPSINYDNPIFYYGMGRYLYIYIIFSENLKHYFNHVNINLCIDHIEVGENLINKFLNYNKIKINEKLTMEYGKLKSKDNEKADFLMIAEEEKIRALFNNNRVTSQIKEKKNTLSVIKFITYHDRNLGVFDDRATYKIKLYNSYDEEEYFDTYFTNMYCLTAINKKNFINRQKEIIINMNLIPSYRTFHSIAYELKENIRKALYVTISVDCPPGKRIEYFFE